MSLASVYSRTARPAGRSLAAFLASVIACATLVPRASADPSPGTLDTVIAPELNPSTVFAVSVAYPRRKTGSSSFVERIFAGGDAFGLTLDSSSGNLVTTFTAPLFGSQARSVYTIVELPASEYTDDTNPLFYVGGLFGKTATTSGKETPAQNIKRLALTGVVDSTFDVGTGADNYVTSILPLNDAAGSVVAAGLFTTFNKQNYPHVVRLTFAGAISPGFSPVAVNDEVFALASQIVPTLGTPDPAAPQFLIGGTFTAIGNDSYAKLARINYDGSVDASFKPLLDERVLAIATQPDGKIIIGGQFSSVDGQAVNRLARLNQDGSLDPTFSAGVTMQPEPGTTPVAVYAINLLPDGRMYVGGHFDAANGVKRSYLARLNSDGSLDASFDPGSAITNNVQTIAIQQDNRVIVGESVNKKINNVFPASAVRLYGDVLTTLPSVSLLVPKPHAAEGNAASPHRNGLFRLSRYLSDTTVPLTVYFSIGGSANAGTAYKPLKVDHYNGSIDQVTFPAGADTVDIRVRTLDNVLPDAPETLSLTVLPSLNSSALYDVSGPVVGTVSIVNAP